MKKQPNILLITDDQHRWDYYDNRTVPSLRTPNISRLMQQGTTLTNAYSNCPICMPTRMTWCHGLYASQVSSGLLKNNADWPVDLPGMPHALQKSGYYTALIGKLHSLAGLTNRDVCDYEQETRARGFNDVFEVSGKSLSLWYDCEWTRHLSQKGLLEKYRGDVERRIEQKGGAEPYEASFLKPEDSLDGFISGKVCDWLNDYKNNKPFFLHASLCGPHFPYDPPRKYFNRYSPDEMPPPEGVDNPESVVKWQERRAAYCAMIEQIDDEVGNILSAAENRGFLENTIIIFGTDHGDMMGHRDRGHKGTPFDTSVRTPYIVCFPGKVPAGKVLDAPVEAVDLPCSIMEMAGLDGNPEKYLPDSPGISFWKYVTGDQKHHRSWAYSEHGSGWRMCREKEWKYIYQKNGEDMLFDMKNDPWELNNLIEDKTQKDRISMMRRQLVESMTKCVAVKPVISN